MEKHQWTETSDDGTEILFRASHFGGNWNMGSQPQTFGRGDDEQPEWTYYDPIPLDLLQRLRTVLFNKYQRKRCPWKLIEKLDKQIAKLEE